MALGVGTAPAPCPRTIQGRVSSHVEEEKAEGRPAQAHSCANPPPRPEPAPREGGRWLPSSPATCTLCNYPAFKVPLLPNLLPTPLPTPLLTPTAS